MNWDNLVTTTQRAVETIDDDDKVRAALGKFRRSIEIARAQKEDVTEYEVIFAKLEAKFRADVSDRAMRKAASYASKRTELLS